MKILTIMLTILIAASTPAFAQSARSERRSGCKSGNLLQESDPSLVEEMGRFLTELKGAIVKGDKLRVARLVQYPMPFATPSTQFSIRSQQEFVRKYDQILPAKMKELVLKQETRCISRVGAKGFTIGSGEIWFDKFQDGKVKIFGITAVVYPNE